MLNESLTNTAVVFNFLREEEVVIAVGLDFLGSRFSFRLLFC